MPCTLLDKYYFHSNHLPLYSGYASTSMETARSSETQSAIHKTARCHIPEGSTFLCYSHVFSLQWNKNHDPEFRAVNGHSGFFTQY